MGLPRAIGRSAGLVVAGLLVACAGGPGGLEERQRTADLQPVAVPFPVPSSSTRDINNDGFINASEAAGYFARRFGELDQDGDAQLSREEIGLEIDELEDPTAAFSALDRDADRMISQDEYFRSRSASFRQRVDPNSGMMSSSDFDTMIRFKDPLVTDRIEADAAP